MTIEWQYLVCAAIFAGVGLFWWLYGRKLASPRKEFLRVRLSIVCFIGVLIVGVLHLFITYVYDQTCVCHHASVFAQTYAYDQRGIMYVVLGVFAVLILPSCLALAEVVVLHSGDESDDAENSKATSILNNDKS